jgi:serine protease SohB
LEYLYEYGLFFAKALTFVVAVLVILVAVIALTSKQKGKKGSLELIDISELLENTKNEIEEELLSEDVLKQRKKDKKKADKLKAKEAKKLAKTGELAVQENQLFVIDFNGSIDAKEVSSLREEITAILSVATENDEVFVRLESGGGMVHGYGLAASQLQRLKDRKIPLTIAVDKLLQVVVT